MPTLSINLIRDKRLNNDERVIMSVLKYLAGDYEKCETNATNDQIKGLAGVHEDTVTERLKHLEKLGYIKREYVRSNYRVIHILPDPNVSLLSDEQVDKILQKTFSIF